jgi:homoaconitate hydratase
MILAGSFSQTYKRNAINNGFLVLEAPELINDLKDMFGIENLTKKTGMDATIDFSASVIGVNDTEYPLPPVGAAAQEMIITGGLENWVKERI